MVATNSLISIWAAQLTLAREQQRLSQRALAELIGVRQARLCQWEHGVTPTVPHLILWADTLGGEMALLLPREVS